jgi:hypothetical protein
MGRRSEEGNLLIRLRVRGKFFGGNFHGFLSGDSVDLSQFFEEFIRRFDF